MVSRHQRRGAFRSRAARDGRRWCLVRNGSEPHAIICAVEYPKPFTEHEILMLKRDHPTAEIDEYNDEREYVVDRRFLDRVTIVRRYPHIGLIAPKPPGSALWPSINEAQHRESRF